MTLQWLVATFHIIALPIGAVAVFARSNFLRGVTHARDLTPVFIADNLWGLASLLWFVTGLWRAFGGLERGSEYYLSHPLFHIKLTLFVIVGLLEVWPAVTLLTWRRARRRVIPVDLTKAPKIARIGDVQLVLLLVIVSLATAIARGLFVW